MYEVGCENKRKEIQGRPTRGGISEKKVMRKRDVERGRYGGKLGGRGKWDIAKLMSDGGSQQREKREDGLMR